MPGFLNIRRRNIYFSPASAFASRFIFTKTGIYIASVKAMTAPQTAMSISATVGGMLTHRMSVTVTR